MRLLFLLHENYDIFEKHGVEYYLSSNGLVVGEKYRGQGIGEQLLRARGDICKEFGIKMTSSFFVSTCSNRIADKAGFKLDNSIR